MEGGYPYVIIKNIENTTELQIGDRKDQYGSPVSSYISGWQIFGEDLPQNYVVADARGTLTADASGNTMTLSNVAGTWQTGEAVVSTDTVTKSGPEADTMVFVGSIPDGTGINTWGAAEWEVSDDNFVSTMTDTKGINDPLSTQTLAPADRSNINLAADTTYKARLKYTSTNPAGIESVYSDEVNFKTASAPKPNYADGFTCTQGGGGTSYSVYNKGAFGGEKRINNAFSIP